MKTKKTNNIIMEDNAMKVNEYVKPQSVADQLAGKPQKALKDKREEDAEKAKVEVLTPNDEAQGKIDLLV